MGLRGVLAGSSPTRMSVIDDVPVEDSAEHAGVMMTRPAGEAGTVFVMPTGGRQRGQRHRAAATVQGRTPMRNFLVPQSTQMERVAARPFFMVMASMSLDPVLALHFTQ